MAERTIPAGAKCLKPVSARKKLDRGNSWLWDRVKNDPEFPKPIYLGGISPVFLEHEIDAWIAAQAEKPRKAA
jgi:prophage regulatory protein